MPVYLRRPIKLRKLYWITSRKSQLSLANKLLVYKGILKPIWAYGVQLWGSASNINLEILERFQSKSVTDNYGRTVVCAKWGYKTWLTSFNG